MEECEALCTKLAIMSQGHFQCFGNIQHLKSKYGKGYGLILKCNRNDNTARVEEFMRLNVPNSLLKDKQQQTLFYQIKTKSNNNSADSINISLSKLFTLIETNKSLLNLETYSLTQTSLEQVFLAFARKQQKDRKVRDGENNNLAFEMYEDN